MVQEIAIRVRLREQERLGLAEYERIVGSVATVAAVARRWGFSHPSRFAAAYRETYGVAPSVTAAQYRR